MNDDTLSVAVKEAIDYLNAIYTQTPECLNALKGIIKFQKVKKGEIILKIGEVNRKLYFIRHGALHCFYYVGEKEVSNWFFFERAFVVSVGSFYDQVPSRECVVALEDGELLYIPFDKYEELCDTHHCFASLVRRQLQRYLVVFEEHSWFIRKHSAAESILLIKEKMPHLFDRVPQAAIATWLGMEPETFTRNLKNLFGQDMED